ncbi:MAG TPA: CDP-alcohol phosphatidyltransferase family protein [Bacteroidota bacterium]|nr:CDP-alcohol phosphatidyltransferase family protein [Bacteroidota bacterium]
MFDGYRKSLKHPEAEELFDLGFYRPLAWLFVRAVHRTPVTPNQVTMLSLAASLAAAYCFAFGGLSLLWAGAAWYAVANILDCADGQLARVQGSGTPNGRLVDGIADYVGTAAIFLGIGIGFSGLGMNLWPETVVAGLSSVFHAMIFDHRQNSFIAARRGDGDFHRREMEKHLGGGITVPDGAGTNGARADEVGPDGPGTLRGNTPSAGLVSRLYVGYIRIQHHLMDWFLPAPVGDGQAAALRPEDGTMIRLWSFLGPTTNRSALIAFALIGRVDLFLWAVIVPGNLWLAAVWYLQRRLDGRPANPVPGNPS